jgi:PQQ-like domain
MNPQHSFWHTLLVPLLIGVMAFTAYLVYKGNPEIMNTDTYYSVLSKKNKKSEALFHIKNSNESVREDLYATVAPTEVGRISHRLIDAKEENFTTINLSSTEAADGLPYAIEARAIGKSIVAKENTKITVAASNGLVAWAFELPKGQTFSPGPVANLGTALYLSTVDGRIYVFDMLTGDVVWAAVNSKKYIHSPMVNGEKLLLFVEEKPNQRWSLDILDAKTATFIKNLKDLELPLSGNPVVNDGIFYYSTQNGHLYALHLDDGDGAWQSEVSASFRSGPTLIGDRLYLTNEDGLVLVFDKKSGRKVNEIELGSTIQERIAIIDGTNYAVTADLSGYLMVFDYKANKRIWRYNLNMPGQNHPFRLVQLTNQSLAQLNFTSLVRGWMILIPCSSTRLCIFDVKEGRLLHRIDLKGKPLTAPILFTDPTLVLTPVQQSGGATAVVGLQVYEPPKKDGEAAASTGAAPNATAASNVAPASTSPGAQTDGTDKVDK